ncbi:MAG: hypothetical protein KA207_05460 [Burkholderiaceae bacterium]|nr:hypothetical protein [Burkholderiaceae bacterium]
MSSVFLLPSALVLSALVWLLLSTSPSDPVLPAHVEGASTSTAHGVPIATAPQAPASSSQPVLSVPTPKRSFDNAPVVVVGDREWRVLGARESVDSGKTQTVLVLRDEASGQLHYRQSALRLVLKEGEDYEAFIRERTQARRVFVNPLYGDIAVDAALISAEYTALANDARVSQVMFIPLPTPAKPR